MSIVTISLNHAKKMFFFSQNTINYLKLKLLKQFFNISRLHGKYKNQNRKQNYYLKEIDLFKTTYCFQFNVSQNIFLHCIIQSAKSSMKHFQYHKIMMS